MQAHNCETAKVLGGQLSIEQRNAIMSKTVLSRHPNPGAKPAGKFLRAATLGFIEDRFGRRRKVKWPIFLTLGVALPGLAVFALVHAIISPVSLGVWLLAFAMYSLTNLGVTMYYHRQLTHRGYDINPWAERVLSFLAGMSWQGMSTEWVSDHRWHHAYADVIGLDPHSPWEYRGWKGLVWSQWVWLFFRAQTLTNLPGDLKKNRIVMGQTKLWGFPLQATLSLLIPLLWFGWDGLLIAGFLRIAFHMMITGFINSWCHVRGKRTRDSRGREYVADDSRNSWVVALFSFGEGIHNGHHGAPQSPHHGWRAELDAESIAAGVKPERDFRPDFTYRMIQLLALLGLAKNLKLPPKNVNFTEAQIAPKKELRAIKEVDILRLVLPRATDLVSAPAL